MSGTPKLRTLLLGACLLASAGCVSVPQPAGIFDRHDPFDALSGFVYSIETGHWDWAYESLTEESRGRLSKVRMRAAIESYSFAGSGVPLYDVIVRSNRRRDKVEGDTHDYELEYKDARITLHLVRRAQSPDGPTGEAGPWEIDLVRTIEEIGAELE